MIRPPASHRRPSGDTRSMDALDIPRLRGVTHAYAFWCALVAAVTLVVLTPGGVPRAAAAVYGAGLCALFGGSGLYHRWRWHPRWRPILRRIDHSTIFVFIAACYTPVGLLVLEGGIRWVVLITVWAGALRRRTLQRRLDQRAAGAVRRALHRARLGRGDRVPAAVVGAAADAADPDRRRRRALHRRRGDLRARAPEPVAAHVRLPRDLPRVRDPGRGGALRRHGGLDRHARAA